MLRFDRMWMVAVIFLFHGCRIPKVRMGTRQQIAQLERHILIHRAGMRFLLLHAQFRQHFDDHAGFNFKLPRQLVDSDFLHRRDCSI
jgi:hypothetical protein